MLMNLGEAATSAITFDKWDAPARAPFLKKRLGEIVRSKFCLTGWLKTKTAGSSGALGAYEAACTPPAGHAALTRRRGDP